MRADQDEPKTTGGTTTTTAVPLSERARVIYRTCCIEACDPFVRLAKAIVRSHGKIRNKATAWVEDAPAPWWT